MSKFEKLLQKIMGGSSDRNIGFGDLRKLLLGFEFNERIKGSHHIYFKEGVEEIINIQPVEGKAKAYQVKQVRDMIIKYKLIKNDRK